MDSIQRLEQAFEMFSTEVSRQQTLQLYSDETYQSEIVEYRKGVSKPDRRDSEWLRLMNETTRSGKRFLNLHLIDFPVSEYVRYCTAWWYWDWNRCGADIRFLEKNRASKISVELSQLDIWLFDNRSAFIMTYSPEGCFISAEKLSDERLVQAYARYYRDAFSMGREIESMMSEFGIKSAAKDGSGCNEQQQ
jgi:hypothetical protein